MKIKSSAADERRSTNSAINMIAPNVMTTDFMSECVVGS